MSENSLKFFEKWIHYVVRVRREEKMYEHITESTQNVYDSIVSVDKQWQLHENLQYVFLSMIAVDVCICICV